jgi:L-methionine (R)-S-oxide reductase
MFVSKIEKDELDLLPYITFKGEIHRISTKQKAVEAAAWLSRQPVLGFDTETKPRFSAGKMFKPALLQLATKDRSYLFHLKKTGLPKELLDVLSRADIVKVGAAVKDDIVGLQRYEPFTPEGCVDLQDMANDYGIVEKSVRKLSAIVLGKKVSKAQQITNWETFPLTGAQALYAATDAYVCYKIYNTFLQHGEEIKSPRQRMYEEVLEQATALLHDEPDVIANMANVSALIKNTFGFWWVGFYCVQENPPQLVLGPFQGPTACTRIPYGRGVCGTAWEKQETIIVPDVDKFPGHIACSARSQSEIVVPVFDNNGKVRAVLDIDSEKQNTFDKLDKQYLEKITGLFKSMY